MLSRSCGDMVNRHLWIVMLYYRFEIKGTRESEALWPT